MGAALAEDLRDALDGGIRDNDLACGIWCWVVGLEVDSACLALPSSALAPACALVTLPGFTFGLAGLAQADLPGFEGADDAVEDG